MAGETDEFRSLNRTVRDLSREALRILSNYQVAEAPRDLEDTEVLSHSNAGEKIGNQTGTRGASFLGAAGERGSMFQGHHS